jgi:hypothetical protein
VVEAAQFIFEDESKKNKKWFSFRYPKVQRGASTNFRMPMEQISIYVHRTALCTFKIKLKIITVFNLSIGNSNLIQVEQRVLKKIKYQASYFKIKSIRMTTFQSNPKLATLSF